MSTRLEQAQRDYQDGKLHINEHQKIIIAERNKEILGLQQRLREADERIRQLSSLSYLTDQQQFEATSLKKKKLALKDRMQSILRAHYTGSPPQARAQ